MEEIWKIFGTVRFIATGYMQKIPPSPIFKDANRRAFHKHLERISGQDTQSESWLTHLRRINYYCDQENVALLDKEKEGLEVLYNDRTATSVHVAVDVEKGLFEDDAKQFPVDSLNYDLRKFRPGPCFLPDGEIKFKSRD